MRIERLLLLLIVLVILPASTKADTDYHCLSQCVSTGKNGSECLPACTYNAPPPTTAKPQAAGVTSTTVGIVSNHRLLPKTHHVDSDTIIAQAKKPDINESKDYQCIAKCLQANMRYQMCEENCIVLTTKTGTRLVNGTDKPNIMLFDRDKDASPGK